MATSTVPIEQFIDAYLAAARAQETYAQLAETLGTTAEYVRNRRININQALKAHGQPTLEPLGTDGVPGRRNLDWEALGAKVAAGAAGAAGAKGVLPPARKPARRGAKGG